MPKSIQKLVLWTLFSSHPLLNGNEFRSVKHFSDEMISLPCHNDQGLSKSTRKPKGIEILITTSDAIGCAWP
jgi:hypothetical protein